MKKKFLAVFLTLPALYLLLLFVLPIGILATYVFRAGALGEAREVFTLEHIRIFFSTPSYHTLLLRSIGIAFITAVLSVVLAYPLAYFLAFKAGRYKVPLLTLLVIPAWTSWLLRILAWKLLLNSTGLLNLLLLSSGIMRETVPLLLYSSTAVVIALIYVHIPFAAVPIFS